MSPSPRGRSTTTRRGAKSAGSLTSSRLLGQLAQARTWQHAECRGRAQHSSLGPVAEARLQEPLLREARERTDRQVAMPWTPAARELLLRAERRIAVDLAKPLREVATRVMQERALKHARFPLHHGGLVHPPVVEARGAPIEEAEHSIELPAASADRSSQERVAPAEAEAPRRARRGEHLPDLVPK
jgi:hypothetical protein